MTNGVLTINDFNHTTNLVNPVTLSEFAYHTLKRQQFYELDPARPLVLLPMAYEKFTLDSNDSTITKTLKFEPVHPDKVIVYYVPLNGSANKGYYDVDSVDGKDVTVTINGASSGDEIYIYYHAFNVPVYLWIEVPEGGSSFRSIVRVWDLGKLSTIEPDNVKYEIRLPEKIPVAEDMKIAFGTKTSIYVGFVDYDNNPLPYAELELPVIISTLKGEESARGIVNLKGWVADYLKGM